MAERLDWGPQGTLARRGKNVRVQRIKTGGAFWSDEAEEVFFDHLAASCNVTAAAAAVGFTTPTLYRLRRMRPEFAARWQAALEQGYARLEMALVAAANETLGQRAADAPFGECAFPTMTVDQAMNVLRAHRSAVEGGGRRGPGNPPRRRSLDEVRDSIVRKVEAIKHDEREARRAAKERATGRRAVSDAAQGAEPGRAGTADLEPGH